MIRYVRLFHPLGIALQLAAAGEVFGQDNARADTPAKVATHFYRQNAVGVSTASFRDFATSPLFYAGPGIALSTGWLKRSDAKERLLQIGAGFNRASAVIPQSDLIQPVSGATFVQFNLLYLRLWKLEPLSDQKNNVKVGGAFLSSQNVRINPFLGNSSLGVENISNLMASAQLTRDISRKESRRLNLLLFKPTLKPKKRELRFLINTGLINLNHRPDQYAFVDVEELVGLETNPASWALANSRWSLNGWRLNTQLEKITYLPNGNSRSIAYVWDAAHAPGPFEHFQMASHRLMFTYYFHTKTR